MRILILLLFPIFSFSQLSIGILESVQRVSYDPDAQAFITATNNTNNAQKNAINDFVVGLKSDGTWTKMKAVYPFITDNYNLLSYTEDYGNAFWGKNFSSITTNAATAPDGSTTADLLTVSSIGSTFGLTTIETGKYTSSVYVKENTISTFKLFFATTGLGNGVGCVFNLSNGTVGTLTLYGTATGFTGSIVSAGNGWYRCSVTGNIVAGDYFSEYYVSSAGSIYLWGSQLQTETITNYQPINVLQSQYIVSQFKYNLKDPRDLDAAFRLSFVGAWIYKSKGIIGNAINTYANTYLVPSTNLTVSNNHLSTYIQNNTVGNFYDFAASNDAGTIVNELSLIARYTGSLSYYSSAGTYNCSISSTDSRGFTMGTMSGTNTQNIYKNGVNVRNATTSGSSLTTRPLFFGAINAGGAANYYTNRHYSFASVGNALSSTEAVNFYNKVQALQTALGRNL
jgi:hypothetical protein